MTVAAPAGSRTEATEPIDALLSQEDAFHADFGRFCTNKAELIWQAVRWHRETNGHYDRYCARHALPDEPDPQLPLTEVPLLPTVLFKREPQLVTSIGGASQVI